MPTPPALAVAPSGQYSLPLVRCAQLLASCAEVQSMLSGTAAQAFAAIDYPTRDCDTYGEPVPGIIVEGRKVRRGWSGGDQRGELEIAFYDALSEDYAESAGQPLDFKNDAAAWQNRMGAIVGQMMAQSHAPMADFGGEQFNIVSVADLVHPTHMYGVLGNNTDPRWFRFANLLVEWQT